MKYIIFCIPFICAVTLTFAQEDLLSNSIKITLPITQLNKGFITEEIEIHMVTTLNSVTKLNTVVDIKSEHWDTTV